MSPEEKIQQHIEQSIATKQAVLQHCRQEILQAAQSWIACLQAGGKILFCGNGGSAADAQHLAAELVVRLRSQFPRAALPGLALTVDTSILTAAGNDFGFDQIFARQIEALATERDLLVALSTSGNSANVIEAVKTARSKGMKTLALLGGDGGRLKSLVDVALVIPSRNTAHIQECHIMVGHILCQLTEETLFGASD